MLFNSVSFLIFFPLVTFLYFALPHRARAYLLIAASCVFYCAFIPAYLLIILAVIVIDYAAGRLIEALPRWKKPLLIASLCANIGLLAWFKYFNFALSTLWSVWFAVAGPPPFASHLDIILPIGLSFHTFQSMAYTLEVYWGRQKAERNFVIYALYVLFYPQLVAGPIERPQNLLHQFREQHPFSYDRVTSGLKLMLWGFFKKVAVADRLAVVVNQVYGAPHAFHGLAFSMATVFFAFQIYCDFSGYSDIALGAAQVMGIKLMQNFNRPYSARSIAEFWKRWHISLSTWFRDYLYIPLGGNRVPRPRWYFNLFVTFLISGLWHGANWTYVVWGALNGVYLIVEIATARWRVHMGRALGLDQRETLCGVLQVLTTFSLTCVAWVFFRAQSLGDATFILRHFGDGWVDLFWGHWGLLGLDQIRYPLQEWCYCVAGIAIMEGIQGMQRIGSMRRWVASQPVAVRWTLYYAAVMSIVLSGTATPQQFIYFQF
ncbi:MAG TPA: MBOAT family O-acyltransferase [Candidatus Xenobia bacterium]